MVSETRDTDDEEIWTSIDGADLLGYTPIAVRGRIDHVPLKSGGSAPEELEIGVRAHTHPGLMIDLRFQVVDGRFRLVKVSQSAPLDDIRDGGRQWVMKDLRASDLPRIEASWINSARAYLEEWFRHQRLPRTEDIQRRARRGPKGPTDAEVAEVVKLKASGHSFSEIADQLGYSKATVAKWHKRWREQQEAES